MYDGWKSWFEEDTHTIDTLLLRAEVCICDRLNKDPANSQLISLDAQLHSDANIRRTVALYEFDLYVASTCEPWARTQHWQQIEAEKRALEKYATKCGRKYISLVGLILVKMEKYLDVQMD
jgi:hypothetical protein